MAHAVEITQEQADALGLRLYDGYFGVHTQEQAPLALYPNGTRVQKTEFEESSGDVHKIGAQGTVLGSMENVGGVVLYFVEWDDTPKYVFGVIEQRISPVKET